LTGFEQPQENVGISLNSEGGAAKSGADSLHFALSDPDLAKLLDAWPKLPEAIRRAIIARSRLTDEE
jgi:hypothetical protein